MRMFKVRGGLAHGRGITSTQANVVHSLPQTVPVCDSLQSFYGVHSQTSDQHSDLWAITTTRDGRNIVTICNYFTSHPPFGYGVDYHDGLISISTWVVAPKCSSADCAVELGIETAARLKGQNCFDVKLKWNDRVISIGAATITATVQDVEVDPTLLFMRVTCVIWKPSDMENHLKHEFSKQSSALFQKGVMRNNTKRLLAKHLKAPVVLVLGNSLGGWRTYLAECNMASWTYVKHVLQNYGRNCFDGYTDLSMSTKVAEQNHRCVKSTSADIVFDPNTPVTNNQHSVLANRTNKSRLIDLSLRVLLAAKVRLMLTT